MDISVSTKTSFQYDADTISGEKDIDLKLHLLKYKASSNQPATDHPRYWIRQVNFLSNDSLPIHLRHQVLLNATAVKEGQPYSASDLQRTYNNFARLQAVKSTSIRFVEVPDTNQLDCNIQISTNKPHTLSFQPEGTNTAGNLGAAASLTYTNRNLFHGSEQFSIELRGAYEAIKGLEGYTDQNYIEYSAEAKLMFPRFLAPFLSKSFRRRQTASSELSVSWDMQNRPSSIAGCSLQPGAIAGQNPDTISTGASTCSISTMCICRGFLRPSRKITWTMSHNRNAILRYNYEDLFIMKIGFGITYNNGIDAMRANIETAGNLLNGAAKAFGLKKNGEGQYTLFNIAYAQYAKFDFDYTHLMQFDKRNALALHAGFGIAYPYGNSRVLPFEKRYFSGGANSVRGWGVRELGPGKFRGTDGRIDFINQTVIMKLDLNAEYRTSLFWKFQGALSS